jgi:polyphosphate kinase
MTEHHPAADASQKEPKFLNRELQWLEFNDRVLHQAADERTPLLERVRFLSIVTSNLDEFVMKRMGGLRRQLEMGVMEVGYEPTAPLEMITTARERIIPMKKRKAEIYLNEILPALREAGIHLLAYDELTQEERASVRQWYKKNVFPILTPLAVDPGHRFPFISNLSVSLGVMLRRPGDPDEDMLFARVKIPEVIEDWRKIDPKTDRYVLVSDVVANNLHDLFPGMEILEVLPFRVTRNADIEDEYEDTEDLLEQIEHQLHERRFAPVVRLQVGEQPSPRLLQVLCHAMDLKERATSTETNGARGNYRSLDRDRGSAVSGAAFPAVVAGDAGPLAGCQEGRISSA